MKNFLKNLLSDYRKERNLIEEKLNFKQILLFSLYSVLVSIVLLLIPGLVIYNFLILDKLMFLFKILIFVLIIVFTFSYNYFFTVIAKNKNSELEEINFKSMIIVESSLFAFVLIIITAIIMVIV